MLRMIGRMAAFYLCLFQLLLPQAPTVLKVTTHLVEVNVVVHRRNDPVGDLTKNDFEIWDAGVKQQVATFSLETGKLPPAVAAARSKLALPLNTFTNRTELRPTVPNAITVVLLDGLNTKFEDQAYSRKQLINFLQQLKPEDRVALYALGRDLRILHDFTSDSTSLIRAANQHKGRINIEVADSEPADPNTGDADLDQWMAEADQKIADYQTINRVNTTLAALEAIANHVSRLPGRKNLIWISGGFPFSIGLDEFAVSNTQEKRTFSDEMEHAARAVNAAGLAIYPVDARGLIAMPDFAASVAGKANPRQPPPGPANSKAQRNIDQSHDVMNIIANRTGGKAYYNSNDIKSAVRGAIDDSQVSYTLGYYPTHNTWDGKWHEIKVKVNRPGVNVRHRLGYFAFTEQPVTPETRQAGLREAAWSALEATALGLSVRLGAHMPQPDKLRAVLLLDIRNVRLQQVNDRWTGLIDVLFVQQPASDQGAKVLTDSVQLNLTKERYQDALKRGLLFARDLNYADAAYLLRVAVRDAASGNVGSVNIRTDKLKPEPLAPAVPPAGKKN